LHWFAGPGLFLLWGELRRKLVLPEATGFGPGIAIS